MALLPPLPGAPPPARAGRGRHVLSRALWLHVLLTASASIKSLPGSYADLRAGRNETEVFGDVLPKDLLRRVARFYKSWRGRNPHSKLFNEEVRSSRQLQGSAKEAVHHTNWVPLSPEHKPRNAIEEAVQYLAAHIVMPDPDWEGAAWFTQDRPPFAPKEYHTDSDTYSMHHLQERWHPQVSSVLFLNGVGGPTVVYNQTMDSYGSQPRVPSDLHVVFPRKNRFVTFLGDRYHGVLVPVDDADPAKALRTTLLINWWRRRPRESVDDAETCGHEDYAPLLDAAERRRPAAAAAEPARPGMAPTELVYDAPFDHHMDRWIKQALPKDPPPNSTSWKSRAFYSVRYLRPSHHASGLPEDVGIKAWGLWDPRSVVMCNRGHKAACPGRR